MTTPAVTRIRREAYLRRLDRRTWGLISLHTNVVIAHGTKQVCRDAAAEYGFVILSSHPAVSTLSQECYTR